MYIKYNIVTRGLFLLGILNLMISAGQASNQNVINSANYLHRKPAVRTVDTDGYQLTIGAAHVGPWLMRIMKEERFVCGGVYYAPLWVITSANCLYPFRSKLNDLKVDFVMHQTEENNYYGSISTIVVSKRYNFPSNYMDIAMIKLRNPIQRYDGHIEEYAKLCTKPLREYSKLAVVACGGGDSGRHKDLRTEEISLMNKLECEYKYEKLHLTETIACAHEFNQPDVCIFETGCPVTARDEVCGIVNKPKCSKDGPPGLFTDIYQVRHFIRKAVKGRSRKMARTSRRHFWLKK